MTASFKNRLSNVIAWAAFGTFILLFVPLGIAGPFYSAQVDGVRGVDARFIPCTVELLFDDAVDVAVFNEYCADKKDPEYLYKNYGVVSFNQDGKIRSVRHYSSNGKINFSGRTKAYRAMGGSTWAIVILDVYDSADELPVFMFFAAVGALVLNYLMVGSFRFRPWRGV